MKNLVKNDELYNEVDKQLNSPEKNYSDINFIGILNRTDNEHLRLSVGYWITYLNCKPIYKKTEVVIKAPQFISENQWCKDCGAIKLISKKGNYYCSAICWNNKEIDPTGDNITYK